jgi:cell division protein FtsL
MSAAVAMHKIASSDRRQSCWLGTPEIYFRKRIDNSRLVKVEDPRREREMRIFGITLCVLFLLVMGYALQHFRAIEYGYKIETLRAQRDDLTGMNQALRLEEASLRSPERIDAVARRLGLQAPSPGQVIPMDSVADQGAPVLASVQPVAVVSAR